VQWKVNVGNESVDPPPEIACPSCKGTNTFRTGAYSFEPPSRGLRESGDWEGLLLTVYDRRCNDCGHLFSEQVFAG
jgi:phage FluMu protein Com